MGPQWHRGERVDTVRGVELYSHNAVQDHRDPPRLARWRELRRLSPSLCALSCAAGWSLSRCAPPTARSCRCARGRRRGRHAARLAGGDSRRAWVPASPAAAVLRQRGARLCRRTGVDSALAAAVLSAALFLDHLTRQQRRRGAPRRASARRAAEAPRSERRRGRAGARSLRPLHARCDPRARRRLGRAGRPLPDESDVAPPCPSEPVPVAGQRTRSAVPFRRRAASCPSAATTRPAGDGREPQLGRLGSAPAPAAGGRHRSAAVVSGHGPLRGSGESDEELVAAASATTVQIYRAREEYQRTALLGLCPWKVPATQLRPLWVG